MSMDFNEIKERLKDLPDEEIEVIDSRSQLVASLPEGIVEINPDEAQPVECSTIITPDTHIPLTEEEVEGMRLKGLEEVSLLRKNETEYDKLKRKAEYCKVVSLYDMNEPVYSNVREMDALTRLKYVERVTDYFDNKDIDFLETRFNTIMKCILIDGDVSQIPF
jgi:hypothetical protein